MIFSKDFPGYGVIIADIDRREQLVKITNEYINFP